MNVEARFLRLGLLTMFHTWARKESIRGKKFFNARFKFSAWGYTYISRASFMTMNLRKYCVENKPKETIARVGSGLLWHKVFRRVFYRLGNNRGVLAKKYFKKWKTLEGGITDLRDSYAVMKKSKNFSARKLAGFPSLGFYKANNYKILIYLTGLVKKNLYNSSLPFKLKYLNSILNLNFFIKNSTSSKKNKNLKKVIDWFVSRNKIRPRRNWSKGLSRKIVPLNYAYFDFFFLYIWS